MSAAKQRGRGESSPVGRLIRRRFAAAACALLAAIAPSGARRTAAEEVATSRPSLFPAPFVAERRVTEYDAGDRVEHQTPTVTEHYGGSHLVASAGGEDRTIVDFARREITEVSVTKGTYWVLSFGRMRELRERLARADAAASGASPKPAARTGAASGQQPPRIQVVDVAASARPGPLSTGARHVRASAAGSSLAVDAWVDGRVRLGAEARDALRNLETEALGPVGSERPEAAELLAAARDFVEGAFPVRVRRPVLDADGRASGGAVEDEVVRLEPLASFPGKLLVVPEGLKRVASPLEAMVAVAEEDAALRQGRAR